MTYMIRIQLQALLCFYFFLLSMHFIITYHHLVEAYDEEKRTKSI